MNENSMQHQPLNITNMPRMQSEPKDFEARVLESLNRATETSNTSALEGPIRTVENVSTNDLLSPLKLVKTEAPNVEINETGVLPGGRGNSSSISKQENINLPEQQAVMELFKGKWNLLGGKINSGLTSTWRFIQGLTSYDPDSGMIDEWAKRQAKNPGTPFRKAA